MQQASIATVDNPLSRPVRRRLDDVGDFARAAGVTLLIQLTVVALVWLFLMGYAEEMSFPDTLTEAIWLMVVFAPLVETVIFYGILSFARHVLKRGRVIAVIGASILALMHFGSGWVKVLSVFPLFFWWGCCYLRLATQERRIRHKFAFLAALHAAGNLTPVLAYYVVCPYFGIE